MKKLRSLFFALSLLIAFNCAPVQMDAQCPMCRMTAEQNLKDGGTAGAGLNTGILYMLATPYFLVATVGFIWYRNNYRRREEEEVA